MKFVPDLLANPLKTALVVDDDAFSVAIAQRVLNKLGFAECVVAEDGADGLRFFAQMARAPDLILCDIFMPNIDGIEFLDALAKLHYKGQVVLISGGRAAMLEMAGLLAHTGGLNVTAKISKPLDQEQLAQALGLSPVA
jgi:CheY-like chemotaxis protein